MDTITREEVPEYLRNGTFFTNLDSADQNGFEVPSNCLARNPNIHNTDDLYNVLRSARFWGLEDPPLTVVSCIVQNVATLDSEQLVTDFPEFSMFLSKVAYVGERKRDKVVFAAMCRGLGLDVIQHLHYNDGFPLSTKAFLAAIALDDLPSAQWLLCEGCRWPEHSVITTLRYGALNCLKYALECGQPLPEGAITQAAMYQQLNVLQHLISNGIQPESYTMQCVLPRGNIEVIRMLHKAGCELSDSAMITFVIYNHLDCLIYAHESGCTWTADLCATAAGCGHLRCLDYLHLHGCPWDTATLIMAAKPGHFQCLRYAHQHGCAMTALVTKYALNNYSWDCLLYCVWQGAMDRDLKLWFISTFSVVCMLFWQWLANKVIKTALCMVCFCALYYTFCVFEMSMSAKLAKVLRYIVVMAIVFVGADVVNIFW